MLEGPDGDILNFGIAVRVGKCDAQSLPGVRRKIRYRRRHGVTG